MGYLVGTAAALATSSDLPNMNPEKVIGFVGGENGPVINDFLVGYIQGAQAADPDVKIDTQYVGNFYDTGAAKELANVMIGQNKCDIVWGVAGGAGNGAAEAANEAEGLVSSAVDSEPGGHLLDRAARACRGHPLLRAQEHRRFHHLGHQ